MRHTLILAAAAMALIAGTAFAGDIMSCSYDLPPPPVAAPTVATALACMHGAEKTQATLAELASQGWNLNTVVPTPGSMTFYLTK